MIQYRLLILFLATVTFGICGARNLRRNYNVNTNINTNVPGLLIGRPSREENHHKNQHRPSHFPEKPNFDETRDREESYPVPQYPDREVEDDEPKNYDSAEWDFWPSTDVGDSKLRPDSDVTGGSYGGQVCRDGSYHPVLMNRLQDPFNDQRKKMRNMRLPASRRSGQGFPHAIIEPSYRRTSNWGHLSPRNGPQRRQPVGPSIGPISQENLASNVNSNSNFNFMARRYNSNANSNNNIFGRERFRLPRYRPGGGTKNPFRTTYEVAPPDGPNPFGRVYYVRKQPDYYGQWERQKAEGQDEDQYVPSAESASDEYENNGGYLENDFGSGQGNADFNANSNLNFMSRRMKSRKPRSLENQAKQSSVTPKVDKVASTEMVTEGTGPSAGA